jgi:two-component system CheB/CheR fusion protein
MSHSPAGTIMKAKTSHSRRRPLLRASKDARSKLSTKPSFRVVGVGASAGGLDAFTQLLRPLPLDTGMAFVLVQHLDPGHKSMLAEILSRETRMPVHEVRNNMTLEPDHVYVIPPNAQMTVANGVLHLVSRGQSMDYHKPIDQFLNSLAEDKGPLAVAVILSGADADGAQALQAVKSEGGIVIAQDPSLAKFNTMPAAAVKTGLVDFILPAERIAQELIRIARHPTDFRTKHVLEIEALPRGERELATIYSFLTRDRGVDFTHYKQTTIRRRIQRRMLFKRARTLKDYIKILETHPAEVGTLYDDLLIHVTSFFRDPEVFVNLNKAIFPHITEHRSSKELIRIWVPGCATGEEAYSIAICLLEFLGHRASHTPIQIFGTDISDTVLQKARAGIYTAQSMSSVSADRRRRFFTPVTGGFQVNKEIRHLCVFSKQNVAKDPPFSRLDLISCRNVLIYLSPVLQKKVVPIFNYALKPTGLLLLGKSESLGIFPEYFDAWDRKMKVYSKAAVPIRPHALFSTTDYPVEALTRYSPLATDNTDAPNIQKEADQYVLWKRAPAGVIVDASMNIVQFRGAIGHYLELVPGSASFHLFKLLKEGLLVELRPAILKARRLKVPVRQAGSRVSHNGHLKNVTIEVIPLHQSPANSPHFLILFEEMPAKVAQAGKKGRPALGGKGHGPLMAAIRENARLRKELAATKTYLQSVIDEHERVNEELRSANEESLSSNEEFQSTNEELETAKEELQATNEETSTLNEDLHNRNLELNHVNSDLLNLMRSVDVPTVILGTDHRIHRLTSAAENVLNMTPADIGRSIHDLKLTISVLDLKGLIDSVLTTLEPQQREIQDVGGHWYNLRVHIYKTITGEIDGVVLSFSDIQSAKELQKKAAEWTSELEIRVKQRTEELARSQSALLQSEKLEAVGRLAGGVAHDFNNLMTGILGMTQDVQEVLGKDSPHRADLEDVIQAAKKAMSVTKQLLAFGRRQVFDPRVLNINNVIGDMKKLLERLLGEDIEVSSVLDPLLGNCSVDQSSIEQVILNLCLNARDAMPKGGRITLSTLNTEISGDITKYVNTKVSQNLEIPKGPYVMLTVTDEGSGIDPEVIPHIFEPFFTTKGDGKGTGLGLATVYGIVKQSGGGISVESKLGKGTSFTIYLPRLAAVSMSSLPLSILPQTIGGAETILVTEDEEIVRKVVVRTLRKNGYTVLHAVSGKEAIRISDKHAEPIHLLLTDVIMPGMNGRELAQTLLRKRPDLAVLYMSGYEKATIAQRGVLEPGMAFIEKSFSSDGLCKKVREVLDSAAKKETHA